MDRKVLIDLIRNGMRYPAGRHQIWIWRCFEITVHPNRVVAVDEYETYGESNGSRPKNGGGRRSGMFHVGRSVLCLKQRRLIAETSGTGWTRPGQGPR